MAKIILTKDGLRFVGIDFDHGRPDTIVAMSRKKDAVNEARRLNWPAKLVHKGFTNLFSFWVIGQQQDQNIFRVMRKNGTWTDFYFEHD